MLEREPTETISQSPDSRELSAVARSQELFSVAEVLRRENVGGEEEKRDFNELFQQMAIISKVFDPNYTSKIFYTEHEVQIGRMSLDDPSTNTERYFTVVVDSLKPGEPTYYCVVNPEIATRKKWVGVEKLTQSNGNEYFIPGKEDKETMVGLFSQSLKNKLDYMRTLDRHPSPEQLKVTADFLESIGMQSPEARAAFFEEGRRQIREEILATYQKVEEILPRLRKYEGYSGCKDFLGFFGDAQRSLTVRGSDDDKEHTIADIELDDEISLARVIYSYHYIDKTHGFRELFSRAEAYLQRIADEESAGNRYNLKLDIEPDSGSWGFNACIITRDGEVQKPDVTENHKGGLQSVSVKRYEKVGPDSLVLHTKLHVPSPQTLSKNPETSLNIDIDLPRGGAIAEPQLQTLIREIEKETPEMGLGVSKKVLLVTVKNILQRRGETPSGTFYFSHKVNGEGKAYYWPSGGNKIPIRAKSI